MHANQSHDPCDGGCSKRPPRSPKRPPRWPHDGPRGPQDGPERAPRRPKRPPRRRRWSPIWPPRRLRWPQDAAKTAQYAPKTAYVRWHQDGPRRPKRPRRPRRTQTQQSTLLLLLHRLPRPRGVFLEGVSMQERGGRSPFPRREWEDKGGCRLPSPWPASPPQCHSRSFRGVGGSLPCDDGCSKRPPRSPKRPPR